MTIPKVGKEVDDKFWRKPEDCDSCWITISGILRVRNASIHFHMSAHTISVTLAPLRTPAASPSAKSFGIRAREDSLWGGFKLGVQQFPRICHILQIEFAARSRYDMN